MKQKVQIKNGVIIPYRPQKFNDELSYLEGDCIITIEKFSPEVSKDQYGYYFSILAWAAKETECYAGNEPKTLDKYFCNEYLSKTSIIYKDGKPKEITVAESKTSLTKKSFAEFLTKVIAEITQETGCEPPPAEIAIQNKYKTVIKP